ncbi:MAG: 4-hydroxy-3-methylbut-2-enyl diphosphate reductase [Lachnospiraceae bacterium]
MLENCIEKKQGKIFTLGPIIHNEHVVKEMEQKGVITLKEGELPVCSEDCVAVIRSHGVARSVIEKLDEKNIKYVDATCPFVKKIHEIAAEKSTEGYQMVIIGDPGHPEVIGTMGWSKTPCVVISDENELDKLEGYRDNKLCIVSQTTFNYKKFNNIVEKIEKLGYDRVVLNTICNATGKRQKEAKELSLNSEVMLVVGSINSSNTRKLYDICRENCENTYYIQSLDDLISIDFKSNSCVGITAGASTPNNIIQEVSKHVRRIEF